MRRAAALCARSAFCTSFAMVSCIFAPSLALEGARKTITRPSHDFRHHMREECLATEVLLALFGTSHRRDEGKAFRKERPCEEELEARAKLSAATQDARECRPRQSSGTDAYRVDLGV